MNVFLNLKTLEIVQLNLFITAFIKLVLRIIIILKFISYDSEFVTDQENLFDPGFKIHSQES